MANVSRGSRNTGQSISQVLLLGESENFIPFRPPVYYFVPPSGEMIGSFNSCFPQPCVNGLEILYAVLCRYRSHTPGGRRHGESPHPLAEQQQALR